MTITKEWVEDISLPGTFEIGVSEGLPVYLTFEKDKIFFNVSLIDDSYSIEIKTKDEVIRLCDGLRVKRFEFKTWVAEAALYRVNPTTYCIGTLEGIPVYISFEKKETFLTYFLNRRITSVPVKTKAKVLKLCKELGVENDKHKTN